VSRPKSWHVHREGRADASPPEVESRSELRRSCRHGASSSPAVRPPFRVLPVRRVSPYGLGDSSLAFAQWAGLRGLPRVRRSLQDSSPDANPLVGLVLLQSMTRTEPLRSRPASAPLPLLGFLAPSAHEATGSDSRRACLTRLRSAFRLPRPLDALLLPKPVRLFFTPVALVGFTLQRFPLRTRRAPSREALPLVAFVGGTPRGAPPSRPRLLEDGFGPGGLQGFELIRNPFVRSPAVRPNDWSRLLSWVSMLSRVFAPPITARPLPCLLSCTSGRRARGPTNLCSRVSMTGGLAGLSRDCRPS
jgi:hypothetical protein